MNLARSQLVTRIRYTIKAILNKVSNSSMLFKVKY